MSLAWARMGMGEAVLDRCGRGWAEFVPGLDLPGNGLGRASAGLGRAGLGSPILEWSGLALSWTWASLWLGVSGYRLPWAWTGLGMSWPGQLLPEHDPALAWAGLGMAWDKHFLGWTWSFHEVGMG